MIDEIISYVLDLAIEQSHYKISSDVSRKLSNDVFFQVSRQVEDNVGNQIKLNIKQNDNK